MKFRIYQLLVIIQQPMGLWKSATEFKMLSWTILFCFSPFCFLVCCGAEGHLHTASPPPLTEAMWPTCPARSTFPSMYHIVQRPRSEKSVFSAAILFMTTVWRVSWDLESAGIKTLSLKICGSQWTVGFFFFSFFCNMWQWYLDVLSTTCSFLILFVT